MFRDRQFLVLSSLNDAATSLRVTGWSLATAMKQSGMAICGLTLFPEMVVDSDVSSALHCVWYGIHENDTRRRSEMTRLKKVAIYNIAVVLAAIGAVSTLYYWTRQPYISLMGMPILVALFFAERLFKGKGGPEWDERERRIGGKAKLAGYTVFWVCHILGLSLVPYLLGCKSEMPVWLLSYIPITSVYILICSMSLALVYFESEPPLAGVKRLGFWLVVLLFCLPLVGAANFARSSQFEAAFAGDELAEWHIVFPVPVNKTDQRISVIFC